MPEPNTFGTFLQTLDALRTSGDKTSRASTLSQAMAELVKEIAKNGDQLPLEQLTKEATSRADLLDAIFAAKDRGLIDIVEDKGGTTAHLTKLGKSLSGV